MDFSNIEEENQLKLQKQEGSEELLTPTLPDKLEIIQPNGSPDKSATYEESKTFEDDSKLLQKMLSVEEPEEMTEDEELLLMPQRTQSQFIESNQRADDLLLAGTDAVVDSESDKHKSIDKMLLDGEADEGCGAHDDDEMLV